MEITNEIIAMGITNEIIARVIAPYVKNKIRWHDMAGDIVDTILHGIIHKPLKGRIDGWMAFTMWNGIEHFEKITNCKPILKPLSAITNEDAIEVYQLISGQVHFDVFKEIIKCRVLGDVSINIRCSDLDEVLNIGFNGEIVWYNDKTKPEVVLRRINFLKIYQFLQSRGYDLPHYLLEGKTLFESGLCIYE